MSDENIKLYPDARMPTEEERRKLCEMLDRALIDIRGLGNNGKAEQAADLADAFHNVPGNLWSEHFSFGAFRMFLEDYQRRYPVKGEYFDYLGMLDEVMNVSV